MIEKMLNMRMINKVWLSKEEKLYLEREASGKFKFFSPQIRCEFFYLKVMSKVLVVSSKMMRNGLMLGY